PTSKITEEDRDRQSIFSDFWSKITWELKKLYITSSLNESDVQQKTVEAKSRRQKIGNKTALMFLVYQKPQGKGQEQSEVRKTAFDFLCQKLNRIIADQLQANSTWNLPSHTKQTCTMLFDEMNLVQYIHLKRTNVTSVVNIWLEICKNKIIRNTYLEKQKPMMNSDKAMCLTKKVITMDLQAVLLCPKLQASALYYHTKLACHNFTIMDISCKSVSCYFWTEVEGDLTASSFTSVYFGLY
ncbi:LOW QUALITY PROTEIN: hypothetical protein MAR_021347, partial [Mya arenaria]